MWFCVEGSSYPWCNIINLLFGAFYVICKLNCVAFTKSFSCPEVQTLLSFNIVPIAFISVGVLGYLRTPNSQRFHPWYYTQTYSPYLCTVCLVSVHHHILVSTARSVCTVPHFCLSAGLGKLINWFWNESLGSLGHCFVTESAVCRSSYSCNQPTLAWTRLNYRC